MTISYSWEILIWENLIKLNKLIEGHELCTLISEPKVSILLVCFKIINFTCIGNFLTNQKKKKTCFIKTATFEAGLFDRHKHIAMMLRSTFAKGKPNKIFSHCYKNFSKQKLEEALKTQLLPVSDFESLHLAYKFTLNQFAPVKQKYVRNNNDLSRQNPFVKLL